MPYVTTTPAAISQPNQRWLSALAPSITDCFLAALLAWLFLAGGAKGLLGDGDTGWHIRTGDYILSHGAVPHQDIFSFTKPNEPWFAWEWLSDIIFAYVHGIWGLKAVALVGGLALVGAAVIGFCRMLWSGGNLFLSLVVALFANGATLVHFLARPHVFTFLLLAISLWLLARDARTQDGLVWLLVPITALWVNLHGGFVALIACLGLMVVGYAIQCIFDKDANLPFVKRYVLLGAACALATLANPYGYKLHLHIAGYLQSSFVLDAVDEFQSPKFRGEHMLQFEALLFVGIAVAGLLLAKKRFVEALLILFWAQESLTSVRHAPIYVIVAAPILVEELTCGWNSWSRNKSRQSLIGVLRDLGAEFSSATLRPTIWAPVMIFALSVSMVNGSTEMWPMEFPKVTFPILVINQFSAKLAPTGSSKPRIFTSDQWADYLTYRFYPRTKVFVDGRSDLFGPELGKEYVHLASGYYDWESILDKYRIDIALVPAQWPLAELLKRDPGWRLLKDDKLAILYERRSPVLTPVLMESQVSAELSVSSKRIALP